ncbi:phosphatase PAP2 family protein [Bradyrhizobium prioriisuperbiae]|uniref:phosphatase PAP2 family protein n=1 Tax=Bradyrhizobium prioriisuperbiae TaxID=2854389 RepID=UPI0028F07237|nr:phosphatase PAP2 family protein [Bradyrhizobium prioritasuperba]
MTRTGLFVALALSLAFLVVFGLHPELDLKIAAWFYDPVTKTFPLKSNLFAIIVRDVVMWVAWAFAVPSIIAVAVKFARPLKPLIMPGRTVVFLLITIVLSAGILSNLVFKGHWGRPRPVMVAEFNGPWEFKSWYDPSGACPKNCSFFSGEGATAFWTYAPAALAPPAWRPLAYVGATLFGLATGGLRMAFGGHFLTDVLVSGLVPFFVIWLAYALIYRWPRTRLTDERVDATLTRWALPGYRWLQRLLRR